MCNWTITLSSMLQLLYFLFQAKVQDRLEVRGKIGLLASLYFGSELIVPYIYSALLMGLRNSLHLSNEDARFLYLHIGMDCDHAKNLQRLITYHCNTKADRQEFVQCTKMILNARVAFYDALCCHDNDYSCNSNSQQMDSTKKEASALYNEQASKWSRDKPRCLSDFTGRPLVYDMIRDHIQGATVLDLGCGEGYVSRKMTSMGAKKVVGIDVSGGMIKCAKEHKDKSNTEYFIVGDASEAKKNLADNSSEANIMVRRFSTQIERRFPLFPEECSHLNYFRSIL